MAIATVWRWPPESEETLWRTDFTVRTESEASVVRARSSMVSSSSRIPVLMLLAAEEHVLDDVEVVAQREVLVDDLDAERRGVLGAVDRDRLALEEELPGVGAVDAGDRLDQRRLAGAVVTDEGGDLARVDLEVDVVQHLDGAEALVDSTQLEQWLRS